MNQYRVLRKGSGKTRVLDQSGAESGAPDARVAALPPKLAALVDAWPTLPEAVKTVTVAMVQAAK
jgi:hypothetical protein